MKNGYTIVSLREFPAVHPVLAYWAYDQWYKQRQITYEIALLEYKKRSISAELPRTFVALAEGKLPVGMVTLKKHDLASEKIENGLTPWLSALYVEPAHRKKGVGQALVLKVIEYASELEYKEVFLFVDNRNIKNLLAFYERIGWIYRQGGIDSENNKVKILEYKI